VCACLQNDSDRSGCPAAPIAVSPTATNSATVSNVYPMQLLLVSATEAVPVQSCDGSRFVVDPTAKTYCPLGSENRSTRWHSQNRNGVSPLPGRHHRTPARTDSWATVALHEPFRNTNRLQTCTIEMIARHFARPLTQNNICEQAIQNIDRFFAKTIAQMSHV
jgi:hypothetical protein